MLDRHRVTDFIEHMLAAGRLVFRCKPVGKLRAVVGQDFGDFDWAGDLQPAQEIDTAAIGHIAIDVQKHPARGAVNGHKQVATRRLIGHLWQVFNIDVNEARLIVFERLFGRDRFAFGLWNNILQARHAFALEKTGDAGPRDGCVDVFTCDVEQVVERR